ncbi:MAG: acetate kinase [Acidobacteria bacterium]|nr:acetate kinase [Acidobacteriota bacterium]
MLVLVLNAGSSSQKSALFDLPSRTSTDPARPVWEGRLEWEGNRQTLTSENFQGKRVQVSAEIPADERSSSVETMLRGLWTGPVAVVASPGEIRAVGHRIVHGGPNLSEPVIITADVKRTIREVFDIAPLHNRAGLEGIELAEKLIPQACQAAVFDTGFHRTLPLESLVYPGPYEWYQHGIRRYGFHGISHAYSARRAAELVGRKPSALKIVTCHLGNGCSLAAVDAGRSVDTTMGFTPLEGLMMGTRAGSIDPGILSHLVRTGSARETELDDILNHRSGLLGISGVSSDMRDVERAAAEGNERAKLAFAIFVHRLQGGIASMAASLGGLDALVFTAGIGENSASVRRSACRGLAFLGVQVDEEKNSSAHPDADISSPDSPVRILVIRAQEDWAIAQASLDLIRSLQPAAL